VKQNLLSPKQKFLLDITEEQGFLRMKDLRIYSNKYYALKVIKCLCQLGYLRKIIFLNIWKLGD